MMRKTKINAILSEIVFLAREAKKMSAGVCMSEYNGEKNKKYVLKVKDKINELCTQLEDEVFSIRSIINN